MIKKISIYLFTSSMLLSLVLFYVNAQCEIPEEEKQRLFQENISLFEKLTCLDKELKKSHSNLGYLYGQKKDWDMAIAQYLKALEYSPEDKDVHFNLGYLYTQKGELDKAVKEFDEVMRLDPKDKGAYQNLVFINKNLEYREFEGQQGQLTKEQKQRELQNQELLKQNFQT